MVWLIAVISHAELEESFLWGCFFVLDTCVSLPWRILGIFGW